MQVRLDGKSLYFGSLSVKEEQYVSGDFIGLSLSPRHAREIRHSAYDPLPASDNSIPRIQSQDVFEHLDYAKLPGILNEVYRVLVPGGIFRLSVPDYNSPLLRRRSVFDEHGEVIADLLMATTVSIAENRADRKITFATDGNAHLWFPTYASVLSLIVRSDIRFCRDITFHHAFITPNRWMTEPVPDLGMPVMRCPPRDMRAGGKPISIIVDFVK